MHVVTASYPLQFHNELTIVLSLGQIDPECVCMRACVWSVASPGRSGLGLGWPKDCHYPILLG